MRDRVENGRGIKSDRQVKKDKGKEERNVGGYSKEEDEEDAREVI